MKTNKGILNKHVSNPCQISLIKNFCSSKPFNECTELATWSLLVSQAGGTLSRSKKNASQEKSRIKLTLKCSTCFLFSYCEHVCWWPAFLWAVVFWLENVWVRRSLSWPTDLSVLWLLECQGRKRETGECWAPRIAMGFVCLKYKGSFSPCFESQS